MGDPPQARHRLTGVVTGGHHGASMTAKRSLPHGAACLGFGALVALSLPPWGWWPLAFVGIAGFSLLVAPVAQRRSRFARGYLFSVGWLAPSLGWMWQLTPPGYFGAVAIFAVFHATATAIAPSGHGRYVALASALTVAEAIRFCFPFGGVPLASLAISQVAGPLAPLARLGGAVAMTWATLAIGAALASMIAGSWWRSALVPAATVAALVGVAVAVPRASTVRTAHVAFVQGGGKQGTLAIEGGPGAVRKVFERHLAETALIERPVDLVVWPENGIDVASFYDSTERALIAAQAARLGAPIAVGVTEEVEDDPAHFVNSQIVVMPDGTLADRYDKVRRVPFGEYIPLRGVLRALGAPIDRVPRDAKAGTTPAVVNVPGLGRVGVVISWEVFFGGRARDGAVHGAQLIINPTNGSSYTGTILQTQQIASSRLRAIEEDRWLVQVSPTGFSAFVTPSGRVIGRTTQVLAVTTTLSLGLRSGRTVYSYVGDIPIVMAALVVLLALLGLSVRRDVDDDGDRAVVDQLDSHLGSKSAGLHDGAAPT